MSKLPFFKRAALRALLWALGEPEQSRTHPLNHVLFARCHEGQWRQPEFRHPQISVGEHTYGLRAECFPLYHPEDRVVIGKFCAVAEGVKFVFGEHRMNCVSTFPFRAICFGGEPHADARSKGMIQVGNDVWLGARSTILSGVNIGHGAVVAAGALVQRDVPPYAVVGGVPARVLKSRLPADQVEALLAIQWWDWPLEKIRANLDGFYSDVDAFIRQHLPGATAK